MDIMVTIVNAVMENLLVPVIAALGSAFLLVLNKWLNKVSNNIIAKNELDKVKKNNDIRNELLKSIDDQVATAVAANMQLADSMKINGNALTQEQIDLLNNNAKQSVMNALPTSLTDPDGSLMEMIGGPDRLDSIINTDMEKHVYLYKISKVMDPPAKKTKKKKKVEEVG